MSTSNNTTENKYMEWEDLKGETNHWHKIFDPKSQDLLDRLLNEKDVEFIYPGDEDIIHKRNKALKDNKFETSLLPKPYRGNLKDPKLVILSLNPGYNERVKKTLFTLLQPECQKQFVEITKENALLEARHIISPDYAVDDVMDNGYWSEKLEDLVKEIGVDSSKIGLIQFIPYASKHYDSWGEETDLKSQEFSVEIIRRLLYKDESTLFLVMRAKKQWEKLFKKYKIELDKEEIKKRFLYNKHPICQKITRDNLMNKDASKPDQYQTILKAFNDNQ